jgi:Acetyltransferase (GNAT) domain
MTVDAVLRHGLSDPHDEEQYLEALNLCFPDWGGRAMFDWCFSRPGAGRVPDILRLLVDGRAVAGNAVSYRRVAIRGGAEVTAGIVSGSWTLPEARGAGAFKRLIAASREQIASRGGALLLGFVRAENASCRGLLSAGADLTPTFYCRSEDAVAPASADIREPAREWSVDAFQGDRGETRFLYSAEEWAAQFVNRPGTVSVLEGPGRWIAVVERTDTFDRVHALAAAPAEWAGGIEALTARAAAAGRRLFLFTTSPAEADVLRRKRFAIVDGFLGVLAADAAALEHAFGVPCPKSDLRAPFSDPRSPWHLGRWALQSGDRM